MVSMIGLSRARKPENTHLTVIHSTRTLRINRNNIFLCLYTFKQLLYFKEVFMGMTTDGLSSWQAELTSEPLLEVTIGDLLDRRAQELATQDAVVYSCYPEFGGAMDIRWTYQEYRERADQVARGLLALGLNKGEHIAVWAVNLAEWLLLYMAAAQAGLVLSTVNPVLPAPPADYVLKQANFPPPSLSSHVRHH